ncbi:MAG: right-handed parallel beta-helix repeat-containing protein [Mycobacterium sp.]
MTKSYEALNHRHTKVHLEKGGPSLNVRRLLTTTAISSVILLSTVLVNPAEAVVLNCGDIISTPNTTVVLTADVSCVGSLEVFGVAIVASGVELDLNGHTIRGDGFRPEDQTSNIGVYVTGGGNNVTVKNGTVTNFNSGVYFEQVTGNTATTLRLVDNIGPDIQQIFGEGLQVFQGGNHTITSNHVIHNGPFAGIVAYGPTNNNTITSNQVLNNNILDPSGHHGEGGPIMQDIGIWLVNLSSNPANTTTNNTIQTNAVSGNGLDGVQVAAFTHGNFVRTNSITNNGFGQPAGNGFRDGDGVAIFGSSNQVQSNQVIQNGGNGIAVELQGSPNPVNGKNNTITGNTAFNNGGAANIPGFDLFDGNVDCDGNVWASNNEGTKNRACIN